VRIKLTVQVLEKKKRGWLTVVFFILKTKGCFEQMLNICFGFAENRRGKLSERIPARFIFIEVNLVAFWLSGKNKVHKNDQNCRTFSKNNKIQNYIHPRK
jgi:hypothetical protein